MEIWREVYNNRISKWLIRFLIKHNISPNQITITNHCITLTFGVYAFSRGTWIGNLVGLAVMLFIGMMDYADGDLAKQTGKVSPLGVWIDSVFDVIIQNAVMAAIAIGCVKNGVSIYFLAFYLVGNAATNLVSFHYNATFGFNSYDGSALFRKYMEQKPTYFNRILKNVIDPTSSAVGLGFFTVRYWITLGAIFNIMPICFIWITVINNFRWAIMYVIYAMHLQKSKKFYVNQSLAIIDEDRQEFHDFRKEDRAV